MGGHLMGQKVTDQVAEMRSLPAGIDQRSPARHPDWLGPDDLALKVQELRELTKNKVPIQLKLGAAKVYDDVRMAAKCDPDWVIWAAWADRITFEDIEKKTGKKESEVIKIMRRSIKPASFRLWRKRQRGSLR